MSTNAFNRKLDEIRPAAGDVLSCGDVWSGPAQRPDGTYELAAGYALYPETGETLCYAHADERQRAELAALPAGKPFTAYVDSQGNLTTWSGGRLADYVPNYSAPWRGNFGGMVYAWQFAGPDGARYYGRNAGNGMAINVRRMAAGK